MNYTETMLGVLFIGVASLYRSFQNDEHVANRLMQFQLEKLFRYATNHILLVHTSGFTHVVVENYPKEINK